MAAYGSTSKLLPGDKIEIKLFNNLYSQTSFFDNSFKRQSGIFRSSWYTGTFSFLHGTSKKVNLGFDLIYRAVSVTEKNEPAFHVLSFSREPDSRNGITYVGPKIRYNPLKRVMNLTAQTAFLFPIGSDREGVLSDQPFLDHNEVTLFTQLFYEKMVSDVTRLTLELDSYIKYDGNFVFFSDGYLSPIKIFLEYQNKLPGSIYGLFEAATVFGSDIVSSLYLQGGVGAKIIVRKSFETEVLITDFFSGKNSGAGFTLNLGFRSIF